MSILQRLRDKANSLPTVPGVYIMKDKANTVIYVGKSRKLKARVSQYFQNSEKNIKTANMVRQVKDFDYYVCDTEIEALSLENTLIKQYNPKYNIRLKDAKSYPYIKITDEEYPRLVFTRKREKDKARYYGPYSGSGTAYSLIELLSRTLRLPTCSRRFPKDIGRERPCIYYQMGRCSGICTGKVTPEEHKATMRYAAELLGGKVTFATDVIGADAKAKVEACKEGECVLLENLRFHKGEEKKTPEFMQALASYCEVYVNDAFGTAHRSHSSTAGIVEEGLVTVAACGFLIEKELSVMADTLENPDRPFVAILGGAKVADKLNVISNLLGNTLVCDNIANATAIAKKYGNMFKIVTLDGDVIATSGSMTGGSRGKEAGSFLSTERKIQERFISSA